MAKLLSKKFKKRILVSVIPYLTYVLLKTLYFTCKKRFYYEGTRQIPEPSIWAFWHGELLMVIKAYLEIRKSSDIDSMISEHSDGEIIARVIKLFGGGVIRGSTTRGAIKALKGAFASIKNGRDIGITPDGPRGPRHSVAEGIVLISKKKRIPIVTLNCKPSSYWQFNSWDKFVVPKPFSTLNFYVGEPFYLDESIKMEEAKEMIRKRLLKNAV